MGFIKIDPETGEETRSGAVSNAVRTDREKPGYFAEWSCKNDPEGRSWRYEGKGKERRFYPINEETKAVSEGIGDE